MSYADIGRSTFNSSRSRTVFIIHGFLQGGDGDSIVRLRDAILAHADWNVIRVDWRS